MGGDMQPQGHVQVLTNIIDFGMNVQEAGDAARWRHYGNAEADRRAVQGIGTVEMESGFDPAVKAELEKRGYKIAPGTGGFGGYQAIMFDAKTPRLLGRVRDAQGRRSDRILREASG